MDAAERDRVLRLPITLPSNYLQTAIQQFQVGLPEHLCLQLYKGTLHSLCVEDVTLELQALLSHASAIRDANGTVGGSLQNK